MNNLYLNQRLNYRNIQLSDASVRQSVGYLTKKGDVRFTVWLGFISRQAAKSIQGARPVRIVNMTRFGEDTAHGPDSIDLNSRVHVHGCLTAKGIYAVVDVSVGTIEKLKQSITNQQ